MTTKAPGVGQGLAARAAASRIRATVASRFPGSSRSRSRKTRDARAASEAILASPSYRRADEDVDFLQRNDLRGVRLAARLPEDGAASRGARHRAHHRRLRQHRICEPMAARRKFEKLRDALARRSRATRSSRSALADRRAHPCEEPLLRCGARVRPPGQRGEPRPRRRAHRRHDRRRPGHHGGRQPRRFRRRREVRRAEHPAAARAVSRTPTSRPTSASTFTTSRCASCISCCGRRRWSPFPAATARSTSCSRC